MRTLTENDCKIDSRRLGRRLWSRRGRLPPRLGSVLLDEHPRKPFDAKQDRKADAKGGDGAIHADADGEVTLLYNDLAVQLLRRHELQASEETVRAMMAAMESFTDAAVAPGH